MYEPFSLSITARRVLRLRSKLKCHDMNRIREIREHLGISIDELAHRVGASSRQIYFLEKGERGLDLKWLGKLSQALGVAPQDLIIGEAVMVLDNDVEPVPHETMGAVGDALAAKNLWLYKVIKDSVSGAGVGVGETITVEQTTEAVARISGGDIALIRVKTGKGDDARLALRIYVERDLFTTNRRHNNVGIRRDDPSLGLEIVGVLVRRR